MPKRLYEKYVLPRVLDSVCGSDRVGVYRAKVVPRAQGEVLEIGMGSGTNLPFYDPVKVSHVWGLEPAAAMRQRAQSRVKAAPFPVSWLDLPGESIPLPAASVDTVLLTFTLCTIPDWEQALVEMHRVLRPGGKLLFCEHGLAHDSGVRRWQQRLNPIWKPCAGGCHLNRSTTECLDAGGFDIVELQQEYMRGAPRFAGFISWGEAIHR